uniref:Uncharacterized protein n=1 Tax=Oncorhynchus mykiss TaxID=8022 RepID=A0A8C7PPV1_ONCMY
HANEHPSNNEYGKLSDEFSLPFHVEEVPLESCTIRFLDNFSRGQHGASSAEYLLESGYAVIFLHRHRSLYPFTLGLICWTIEGSGCGQVMVNQQALPNIGKVLMRYQAVKEARLLLPVEFSTLSEYLHHLKAAAQALRPIGSTAMFYLAAAVSDFYIPASEMPEHKIQSSNGPLQVSKETKPLLSYRSSSAGTGQQAVVASVLDTRRGYVVVVTPYTQAKLVLTDEEASRDVEIEDSIVSNLTRAHSQIITQQD